MKIFDRSGRSVLLRSSLSVLAVLLLTERAGPTQHALESEFAFSIPDRGAWSTATSGTADALRSGYGRIAPSSGSPAPAGIAVFGFRQDGVLLSEAGVPASAPVSGGRLFAEIGGRINTGVAFANPNEQPAVIEFYYTDIRGGRGQAGNFELDAGGHVAAMLSNAPFNPSGGHPGGLSFEGTLTFTASVPVAVIALRILTNEAGELLTTTLPVAALRPTPSAISGAEDPVLRFPHFAAGAGWSTQVVLVNPTDSAISGTVEFLAPDASPATVRLEDGRSGSRFDYAVAAGSAQRFTTSNSAGALKSGSVRATPGTGGAPEGLVVFSYAAGGKTVSEASVPALEKGTAFRVPVEASGAPNRPGAIRTGLAVANTDDAWATVMLEATRRDGRRADVAFTFTLPPEGQRALVLDEIMTLPEDFSGLLEVTSSVEISVIALRTRINERGELKVTTTSPVDVDAQPTYEDRYFAHFADSLGWTTEFILFSQTRGLGTSGTLSLVEAAAAPAPPPPAPPPPAVTGDFDLFWEHTDPWGITFANGRFYVVDNDNDRVSAYDATGRYLPDAGFDLHRDYFALGITFTNGQFYVVDYWDEKLHAYDTTGRYLPDAGFDLTSANLHPTGITFANGRFYVVDHSDKRVYAYDTTGRYRPDAGFDLSPANTNPEGITFANGQFYVTDRGDQKVYAYYSGRNVGRYVPEDDFDLTSANFSPRGITFADGQFYVVDLEGNRVYNYDASGGYVRDTEFDLSRDNRFPEGITFGNGRFYVVGYGNGEYVFAYDAAGRHLPDAGFALSRDNRSPRGITYANGWLYVVERESASIYKDRVYAYDASGGYVPEASFTLTGENSDPTGITYANSHFYVVDEEDDKVYAYDATGEYVPDAGFDLHLRGEFAPTGITFANGLFYVVDRYVDKVSAYDSTGEYVPEASFYLYEENGEPKGITFGNGRFYVIDTTYHYKKVFVYDAYVPSAGFELAGANEYPTGITFGNGHFYVVDADDDKVYAYDATGRHVPDVSFYLSAENVAPEGITFANNRLYVATWYPEEKVHVYASTPTRGSWPVPEEDFDLAGSGIGASPGTALPPSGITAAESWLYVVDGAHVSAYDASGQHVPDARFNLDRSNQYPSGITYVKDHSRFYVLDVEDDKVYAYEAWGGHLPDAGFDLGQDIEELGAGITFANGRFYVVHGSSVDVYDASGRRL